MCSTQPEQHLQVPHQVFNGSRRLRSHPLGGCGMPHMLYYTQISNNLSNIIMQSAENGHVYKKN